jgi:hypothetical protein
MAYCFEWGLGLPKDLVMAQQYYEMVSIFSLLLLLLLYVYLFFLLLLLLHMCMWDALCRAVPGGFPMSPVGVSVLSLSLSASRWC